MESENEGLNQDRLDGEHESERAREYVKWEGFNLEMESVKYCTGSSGRLRIQTRPLRRAARFSCIVLRRCSCARCLSSHDRHPLGSCSGHEREREREREGEGEIISVTVPPAHIHTHFLSLSLQQEWRMKSGEREKTGDGEGEGVKWERERERRGGRGT